MAKDRLSDLIKATDDKGRKDEKIEIENGTSEGTELRKTFERAEVIRQWIEGIEQNVEAVRQYITKLDDIQINQKDLNEKIESLFQNNASIAHKITAKLKDFDEELKETNEDSAEGRIKHIQNNTLKTRFRKIFKQNNVELENYKNIRKLQLEAQLRAKGVRVPEEELVRLLDENVDIQLFTDNIIAETADAKRMLADIEERHQQLLKIERMLEEVRDMFLQMAILIDNQQELIDRVEFQAQKAQSMVDKGKRELSEGEKKKKKYLRRKIYLIIAGVILLTIILALIFTK